MNGAALLAIGILLGIACPFLAETLRPLLPITVYIFVFGTFIRADIKQLRSSIRKPRDAIILPSIVIIVLPLFIGLLLNGLHVPEEVKIAIILTLASPPSSANAALARMLGYSGELPLTIILITTLAAPFTMPLIASFVNLSINPQGLMKGLFILLLSTGLAAIICKYYFKETIHKNLKVIEYLILSALLVFAVASMDGVYNNTINNPKEIGLLLAIVFVLNISMQLIGALLIRGCLYERMASSLTFGNRNVALPWAVLGTVLPEHTVMFFALYQLPIFITPLLLRFMIKLG